MYQEESIINTTKECHSWTVLRSNNSLGQKIEHSQFSNEQEEKDDRVDENDDANFFNEYLPSSIFLGGGEGTFCSACFISVTFGSPGTPGSLNTSLQQQ